MHEEVCPECNGAGSLTYVGGPGYYSTSFGNYLPDDYEYACPVCGGTGLVEVDDAEAPGNEPDHSVLPGESPGSRAA
jgi:DnaJ-class molecular chaperone